ncbi:MAG: amidohydrolase family protein, partial [Candidatus Tectomicrobia bacterium]|nr:amidohydrolase family protein [Candidatus Tectomicrobia bacterium]
MRIAMRFINKVSVALVLAGFCGMALSAEETAPTRFLVENVNVWDGTSDGLQLNQNVFVEGKFINAIGRNMEVADNTIVIDGGGRVLIPGIIEAHTHLSVPVPLLEVRDKEWMYLGALSAREAEKMLMRGWTTARDMGGPTQGLAQAIDEGRIIGPRIYTSAMFISQTSGHGDFRSYNEPHPNMGGGANPWGQSYSLIADGPAEVKRAVRESLRRGATQIKIMAGGGISSEYDPVDTHQYSLEELRAAVEAADEWNTYVAAHAYTDQAARKALEAGVKVIEHGHMLSEDTLRLLKEKGAFLSPQSFAYVRVFFAGDNRSAQTQPRPKNGMQIVRGVDNLMRLAKELDIPVAFGTDAIGYPKAFDAAVREFGGRLKWFTSLEILKQATSVNAQLLELTGPRNPYPDGPLGVI